MDFHLSWVRSGISMDGIRRKDGEGEQYLRMRACAYAYVYVYVCMCACVHRVINGVDSIRRKRRGFHLHNLT